MDGQSICYRYCNNNYLCSCRSGSIPIGVAIHVDNGGSNAGKPYFYDITNSSLQSDGPRVDDDEWHHILGVGWNQ